jgi:hypothetical protein
MKWTEVLEQRKALLVGGIAVICLAALLVSARRFNITLDVFWHAKTGIDWLVNGLSPWQDHYSFTFYGEAIKTQPWLFQVIVGWLVTEFGVETGLEILRVVCWVAVFGLVLLFLRKLKSPTWVYLIVLSMVTLLLQQRPVARPELISYSLIVVSVMLYYRARLQMSAATMLPIVLLAWLWNNYHSAVFFYVIFFGLFIDTAVRYLREREAFAQWVKWAAWGAAVVGVGALKPGFQIPFLAMFLGSPDTFSAEWKDLIVEYMPLKSRLESNTLIFAIGVYALGMVTAATVALAIGMRRFGLALICVLMVYFAADMARLVTPLGIAVLCIFAWMVTEAGSTEFFQRLPRWSTAAIGVASLFIVGTTLYSVIWFAQQNMMMNRTFTTGFPKDVTDYMIKNGISGRIFNEQKQGGYLIYRLAPESRIYIDGRTHILYPVSHAKRYVEALRSPGVMLEEIDKYDIDLALLNNRKHNFTLMRDVDRLKLDFVSFEHALFRKENANFPVTGTLLARPACWDDTVMPAILEEQRTALRLLPDRSPALEFLQWLTEFSNSPDRENFLSGLQDVGALNDYTLRFLGYRSLESGLFDQAWKRFTGIRRQELADYLAVATAYIELGNWSQAEGVLDSATRSNWPSPRKYELEILYRLLLEIQSNAEFELFDNEYVDGLGRQFDRAAARKGLPDVDSFCLGF